LRAKTMHTGAVVNHSSEGRAMNTSRRVLGGSMRVGAVIAFASFLMLVPASRAQTPVAEVEAPHPAHIHSGSCDQLGDVVIPLTDVAYVTGDMKGAATAHPVSLSNTDVDMSLDDLLAGEFAINVHESADNIDVYIACGDIGGATFTEDGREMLFIGLREMNDSGHTGVAWLGADGDKTEVAIALVEPDEMQ
jgi:hypothetical protein